MSIIFFLVAIFIGTIDAILVIIILINIIDIIILLFILTRLVIPIFELINSLILSPIKNTIIIDIALLVRLRI